MNLREIKDLITLMNDNDLTEIEVETDGAKIKLKKGQDQVVMQEAPRMMAAQQQVAAPAAAAPAVPAPATGITIKSPMVGTFYSAPAPDAEPYLKVGQKVEVGQVICIVEAMKLMNEIKSEIKGTVTEVHVQNGSPIEFGQVLYTVAP
ncbi:MAG: acetyl-CoA carboxylase biotin carboxyl carrier protein [Candidatus Omnitrophica bacterium]|nr:acetyl-CoA carboxylase biotin carboxyl carrier protein [Candidatus Omnitrophota bacterium]